MVIFIYSLEKTRRICNILLMSQLKFFRKQILTWGLEVQVSGASVKEKGAKQDWARGRFRPCCQPDRLAQHGAPEQRWSVGGVPPSPLNPFIAQSSASDSPDNSWTLVWELRRSPAELTGASQVTPLLTTGHWALPWRGIWEVHLHIGCGWQVCQEANAVTYFETKDRSPFLKVYFSLLW